MFSFLALAENEFIINIAESVRTEWQRNATYEMFDDIYKQLSITPTYVTLPSNRGLKMVNDGTFDAEAGRVKQVGDRYPNLIRIEPHFYSLEPAVFCLSEEQCRLHKQTNIGVVSGFVLGQSICHDITENCIIATNPEDAKNLLHRDLADALLVPLHESHQYLCELPHDNLFFRVVREQAVPLYHYVNKRHAHLVPAIKNALVDTQRRGVIEKLHLFWKTELQQNCGKQLNLVKN